MPTDKRKYFSGDVPTECNHCNKPIESEFIDGSTRFGWMYLCPLCHKQIGNGLGVGLGQRYIYMEPGRWYKDQNIGSVPIVNPNDVFSRVEFNSSKRLKIP